MQALSPAQRYQLAVTSYQYVRYQNNRSQRTQNIAKQSFVLLKKIREYSEFAHDETPPTPFAPEKGHGTTLFSVSGGYNEFQEKAFSDIELRFSYHDLLDNLPGFPTATSLNMGRIKVRADEDHLQLQSFGIAEITSLNPRSAFLNQRLGVCDSAWSVNGLRPRMN